MNEPRTQQEPSMEEILASIRRIISEDAEKEGDVEVEPAAADAELAEEPKRQPAQQPPAQEPRAPAPKAQEPPAEEPVAQQPPEPQPEPAAASDEEQILELTDIVDEEPDIAQEPAAPRRPLPVPPSMLDAYDDEDADNLVLDETADATREAFARLIRESGAEESAPPRSMLLGDGTKTVEDLVRAELRPLLREWLNAHLTDIVDEIVRREVEHIVRNIPRR